MKEDVGLNYSNDNIDLIKIIKSILEKKHLLSLSYNFVAIKTDVRVVVINCKVPVISSINF